MRDGWEAWEWIPGAVDESRLDEILHAGAAFRPLAATVGLADRTR